MPFLPRRRDRSRRGIALLLVMVVLLLVATLATEIALTARTHFRLADHSMNDFLLRSVVDGRRQILLAALRYDETLKDNIDTEADAWSWKNANLSSWGEAGGEASSAESAGTEGPAGRTFRNRDLKFLAWCEDERSKLNLRGLLKPDDLPVFQHTRATLVRIIDLYREQWPELDVSDSDANAMVDDLVEWLRDKEDSDENPLPAAKPNRGRLLSLEDLMRVPGGRWRPEILYDVRDPEQTEEGDFTRRRSEPAQETTTDSSASDPEWTWANGVPGLYRYLTVWAESVADPTFRINVNTAHRVVLKALLEPGQEELADAIVSYRRQGESPGALDSTAGDSSSSSSSDQTQGWFKSKTDLSKVEGLGDDLGRYPRLNFFADVASTVYSLRIIAAVEAGPREGDEETGEAAPDLGPRYQYREVVQRGAQGFLSLHAERRQDPIFGDLTR
jgi:type II secretory pathway component PulK